MKTDLKLQRLRKLDERTLRREVLIPLFRAAGYSDVLEHHGPTEHGKDIIFREVSRLREVFVHAVVVTTHDINGRVGDDKNAARMLEQVEQALNEPYRDKYTGRESSIDRCWVITCGVIKATATDSICSKLEKYNLNKLLRFADGERLVELVDGLFPDYWNRDPEYAYVGSSDRVDISTNTLDPPYDRDVDDLSTGAGSLKDTVYKIKKSIYQLLLTLEFDVSSKLTDILKSSNPREIVDLWEDLEGDVVDHHGRVVIGGYGRTDVYPAMEYLRQDLNDYEERFSIGKSD